MSESTDKTFWDSIDFTFNFISEFNKIYQEEQKIWKNNPKYHFPKQIALLNNLNKTLSNIDKARVNYKEIAYLDKDISIYFNELKNFSKYRRAFLENVSNNPKNIILVGINTI